MAIKYNEILTSDGIINFNATDPRVTTTLNPAGGTVYVHEVTFDKTYEYIQIDVGGKVDVYINDSPIKITLWADKLTIEDMSINKIKIKTEYQGAQVQWYVLR